MLLPFWIRYEHLALLVNIPSGCQGKVFAIEKRRTTRPSLVGAGLVSARDAAPGAHKARLYEDQVPDGAGAGQTLIFSEIGAGRGE